MSSRKCDNCKCKCLLVSVGCIKSQLNPFTPTTKDTDVRAAIDAATIRYVLPLLGEDCFESICTALDASELPTGGQGYIKLPDHYATLIDTYVTGLISEAATALYIDSYGFERLSISLEEEAALMYTKRKYASAAALKQNLKQWLEDETIKALFPCLPSVAEVVDCPVEGIGISTPFGDFAVSTKYPSNLRDQNRDPRKHT